MKAIVRRINGVRGFMPTTYAVYQGERVIQIFPTKKEAIQYADAINK